MATTSASVARQASAFFSAPKLGIDPIRGAPIPLTLWDGSDVELFNQLYVSLTQLPKQAFDPKLDMEIRLFRYTKAKSDGNHRPRSRPAGWTACRHIEGGVNAYDTTNWLGGYPITANIADTQDRRGRIKFSSILPDPIAARVPIEELVADWIRVSTGIYYDTANNKTGIDIITSTQDARHGVPSESRGYSRNIKPVRFAVGFVGKDLKNPNYWVLYSPLSKFIVQTNKHPLVYAYGDPLNQPRTPGFSGKQVWAVDPFYTHKALSYRITDSEALAGSHR